MWTTNMIDYSNLIGETLLFLIIENYHLRSRNVNKFSVDFCGLPFSEVRKGIQFPVFSPKTGNMGNYLPIKILSPNPI